MFCCNCCMRSTLEEEEDQPHGSLVPLFLSYCNATYTHYVEKVMPTLAFTPFYILSIYGNLNKTGLPMKHLGHR